jgi:hypothetical protein
LNTITCPKCSKSNDAGFAFCMYCGTSLTLSEKPRDADEKIFSPAVSSVARSEATRYPPKIGQMGEADYIGFDLWDPFAGFGRRGRHVSWLLNNLGNQAEALRDEVIKRFESRKIPEANDSPQRLSGKGFFAEQRPYYIIRRKIVSVGLYISRFGEDLYISQVTYAKGAISFGRMLLLALMIISVIFIFAELASFVTSIFLLVGISASDSEIITYILGLLAALRNYFNSYLSSLSCILFPIGILSMFFIPLIIIHMLYRAYTDRDPFLLLRSPLNEFQQDDIIALEKAVEETVRQSLDSIGIDVNLMPPAAEYGIKRTII